MNRREFLSEIVNNLQIVLNFKVIRTVVKTSLRFQKSGIRPLRVRRIVLRQAINIVAVERPRNRRIQQGNRIQRNRLGTLNEIELKRCSRCRHITEILIIRRFELRARCRRVICRRPISRIKLVISYNREKHKMEGTGLAEQIHIGYIRVLSLHLGIVRTDESRIERIRIKAVYTVAPRRGRSQRRIIIARVSHRQFDAVVALKPVEHDAALLKEISLIRELKLKLCTGTDVAFRLMHGDLEALALMCNQVVIAVITGTKQHLCIAVRAGHPRIRGPRSSTDIAERNITRHPTVAIRVIRYRISRILVARFKL